MLLATFAISFFNCFFVSSAHLSHIRRSNKTRYKTNRYSIFFTIIHLFPFFLESDTANLKRCSCNGLGQRSSCCELIVSNWIDYKLSVYVFLISNYGQGIYFSMKCSSKWLISLMCKQELDQFFMINKLLIKLYNAEMLCLNRTHQNFENIYSYASQWCTFTEKVKLRLWYSKETISTTPSNQSANHSSILVTFSNHHPIPAESTKLIIQQTDCP